MNQEKRIVCRVGGDISRLNKFLLVALMSASSIPMNAQTALDLKNQVRNVDFSEAPSTRVWKTGTTLPSTCSTGEGFFLSISPKGALYVCVSSNTWGPVVTPLAGAGSLVQTTNGPLPSGSVPAVDATGTQIGSGCTVVAGAMNCGGGFIGGAGASRITVSEGPAPGSPASGQKTIYLDSTDHSLKAIDSVGTVRAYATIDGSENLTNKTFSNPSLAATALTWSIANESTTGTQTNMLAKLTGAPSTALLPGTTDTGGIAGVVVSGSGTSGVASIAVAGQANCLFDGATVAGDYVTISTSVAGACHDNGAAYPITVQALGRVLASNANAGTYPVELFGTEAHGTTAIQAGSGFDPLDTTTAWWRDEMLTNNQWYFFANNGGSLMPGDYVNGDYAHPGSINLNSGSDPGSNVQMALAWSNGGQNVRYPAGTAWDMRWIVKPASVGRARFDAGFVNYNGSSVLAVSYDPAISPNWLGVTKNSGAESTVDLGIAATTNWFTLRMRSDGSNIFFSVNDGAEKSSCPSGCDLSATNGLTRDLQVWPFAGVANRNAGGTTLTLDFFALKISGLTR